MLFSPSSATRMLATRVGLAGRDVGVRAVDAFGAPERQRRAAERVVAQARDDRHLAPSRAQTDGDVAALAAGADAEAVAEHRLAAAGQPRHPRHEVDVPAGDADDVRRPAHFTP